MQGFGDFLTHTSFDYTLLEVKPGIRVQVKCGNSATERLIKKVLLRSNQVKQYRG